MLFLLFGVPMPALSRRKRKVLKHVAVLTRYCFFENYSAAEKLLNEVGSQLKVDGAWGEGCFSAVRGMISAGREGNPITFYWRIRNADPKTLLHIRRSLMADLSRDNVDSFERGFLQAWIGIVDAVIEIHKNLIKK